MHTCYEVFALPLPVPVWAPGLLVALVSGIGWGSICPYCGCTSVPPHPEVGALRSSSVTDSNLISLTCALQASSWPEFNTPTWWFLFWLSYPSGEMELVEGVYVNVYSKKDSLE